MSINSSERDTNDEPRPICEFQATLDQFLDVPSSRRVLLATLPYGSMRIKQAPNGQQGQNYDAIILNQQGAYCDRQRFDRRELKQFLDRDDHELRVQKGNIGDLWPSRVAEVRP